MLNEDRDAATLSTAAVRFFRGLHGIHEPILLMPEGLHPRQGRHTQGTHQVQLLTNLDALTAHYRVLSHLVYTQDDHLSQDLHASQHIHTKDGRHDQVKATHKVHTC